MIEYKKIFDYFKNNLTFILLITYIISFINFYIYYKSFNISIFNYIDISDLIFFFFEYLFKILLIIIIYEIIIYTLYIFIFYFFYEKIILIKKRKFCLFLKSSKKNREKIHNVFNTDFDNGIISFRFILAIILIFVIPLFPYKLVLFPALLLYFFYLLEISIKEKSYEISIPLSLIVIFIFMLLSTMVNAYEKRYHKDEFLISFKENSKILNTSIKKGSYLNYLGETSSHLFLYDIKNKKSLIFSKSNISEIQIDNENDNLDYILQKIKNF